MKKQTRLFWIVLAATIGWMVMMRSLTPSNIIEFEFARTLENVTKIFMDWGESGVAKAKMSILLDFVFLILYSWAISLGCKVAGEFANASIISKVGLRLSRIIWIAAACDLVENVSLLIVIRNRSEVFLEFAFWAAGLKFAIVIVALLFILVTAGIGLMKKLLRPMDRDGSTLS